MRPVLGALAFPVFVDVGLRTFFKRLCVFGRFNSKRLVARQSLFVDKIDTGTYPKPHGVASKTRQLIETCLREPSPCQRSLPLNQYR